MTDAQFNIIAHSLSSFIKEHTPRDTGNLAFNATRIQSMGADAFRIYVNTQGDHLPQSQDGIAPYFTFVNNSQTLRGHSNRNYQYFQKAMKKGIDNLCETLNGYIEGSGK